MNLIWSRKAQNINYSLYVALPKIWTDTAKIKRGSNIKIELLPDGSLKITPEGPQ
jgi:hypothetical protein